MATFLSLCVPSSIWLWQLPPRAEGTGERGAGERGGISLSGIASHHAERFQAACSSCLQKQHSGQTDPAQPSTSPVVSLRSFPRSTHSVMDAAFPPAPISSHSASDQQMLMACICFENEILDKKGTLEGKGFDLFSLIFFSLNSPYQYFSLSAKGL